MWVSPIHFGFLYGGPSVHTQNIWGTMASRDRDLGHSRSFPTGALITRSGLAAPGALDPNIPR